MRPSLPKQPRLAFTPPCLASAVATPPEGDGWLHEIKLDGYRVQALIEREHVRLLTRNGFDWTSRFSGLARHLAALPVTSAAIDGEVVVLDDQGVSRFALLQGELSKGTDKRIVLMAFDLLHFDGRSTTKLPLFERKMLLRRVVAHGEPTDKPVRFVDGIDDQGADAFSRSCRLGLEGIVSKRFDRPYRSGRRGDWTKAKCLRSDPFVVVGFTLQGGERALIGALLLAYFEADRLIYAGRVGTGFSHDEARALADGLAAIRAGPPIFARTLTGRQKSGVVWIEPLIIAQVEWRDVTLDGLLRHATFQHLRTDKSAREIVRPAAFRFADVVGDDDRAMNRRP